MTEMDCQPPKGSDEFANVMLLTANVGSIFEDVSFRISNLENVQKLSLGLERLRSRFNVCLNLKC